MTRWKKGAGLLAVGLLALGPALPAAADPIGEPVAPGNGGQELLRLEIETMTPRVVTADTRQVTVSGRITNTGDRRVDEIQAKVQRGEPVESDAGLRELANLGTDSADSPFVDVSESLEPGESADLTVTTAVSGSDDSLALEQPGVYPLLVNVNGEPDYGDQARLAAVSIPLPVLAVPGGATARPEAEPPGVTIVWPILDTKPRRLATTDGKTVLADDELADSLSVGGRLFGLVHSVATATATNSSLLNSLCFAVDPDLLHTVSDMAAGYSVRDETGGLVPGNGSTAANDWLTRVAELTRGRCVLSVPYADADLVALSRSGAVDLTNLALGSSSIVSEVLSPVQPVKGLFWPAGGSFDQRTLIDLAAIGPTTVLADPGHLQQTTGRAPYTVTGTQTAHPVQALPIDSLVSGSLNVAPPGPGADASLQRGLAALTFRTLFDGRAGGDVLIAPPRRWTASSSELDRYLELAGRLFDGGYAVPRSLQATVTGAPQGTASGLAYTPRDSAREIPAAVTSEVARINAIKRDLLDAMGDDNTNDVDPNALLSPIQYGLLRATSTVWRGDLRAATAAVEQVDEQVEALCDLVRVNNPDRPLALASGDSPIPVPVHNGLPVSIVVRVRVAAPPGLVPQQIQDLPVPPHHTVNAYVPAEVTRAGRFKVDAMLSTPGGTQLGRTAQLELTSTSYGVVTVAITGTAGGVLVILVAFRIFRRVHAARAGQAKGAERIIDGPDE